MAKDDSKKTRVGLLVTIGTALLIITMYLIGDKQNIFGSTFNISANFHNVNGLMVGNNVRFNGINVGTIRHIEIINDSTIQVEMTIENKVREYIKKNTLASVGTDGLMGNKLINLNFSKAESEPIEDGDVLESLKPIETDEMLRTLNRTNEEIGVIVKNLRLITQKVNSPNTLWNLLMDTVVAENVKAAIVNFKITSGQSAVITGDLSSIVRDIKSGKGSVGALLTDTSFAHQLSQTIVNINLVSDSLAYITGDLKNITTKVKNGDGAIGTLLMDTTFVHNLNESLLNIKNGTKGFDDNMEALKHNFLLRKYYKKIEEETKGN